jgi:hypothetical protein
MQITNIHIQLRSDPSYTNGIEKIPSKLCVLPCAYNPSPQKAEARGF